jgi:Spy/CpxP family protein refolding chaperone
MKLIKTLMAAAIVAGSLLTGAALQAQDASTNTPAATTPPAGGRRGGMTLEQLTTALNLTPDEQTKVKPILDGQTQKMRDLRADDTLSADDRRTKMQAIRADTLTQMKGVLTPDQFAQYQKLTARGGRRGAASQATNAPAATPPQQ